MTINDLLAITNIALRDDLNIPGIIAQALQGASLQGLADARPQVVQRLAEECMQTGSGMKTSILEA